MPRPLSLAFHQLRLPLVLKYIYAGIVGEPLDEEKGPEALITLIVICEGDVDETREDLRRNSGGWEYRVEVSSHGQNSNKNPISPLSTTGSLYTSL